MEVRLGNRTKIKSLLQTIGIKSEINFGALFNRAIAKNVLLHFWNSIKQDTPLHALSQFKPEDIIQAIMVESQGRTKPAKMLQQLRGLMLIRSVGLRGAKALMMRHSTRRTWQRLKRELDGLNPATSMKYAAIRHVDVGLSSFCTVELSDCTRQPQNNNLG